ncbi:FxDxF family PEP-CTERM protein [Phenylobacterium sp.]|uniref:FxDxF family PEP-CTERM protein n=1 Tax=Phenylobacterium sp. TaxID=1871053 RepID=UPI0025EB2B90|nr:FxDxF family PEP-CTERM protein [Phenylobacterium sp.]
MTKLIGAVAAIAVMSSASSAGAATIFTQIDQPMLDLFGTATYGATITNLGLFSHSFAFTTTGLNDASSSVVTIELKSGKKDIDFTSVTLNGFAFTHTGFDPGAETWDLTTALLTAGLHHIDLTGTVVTTGSGKNAASYSGTLNLATAVIPEPATWALMIAGFGGAGGMLRTRRRTTLLTA